MPSSDIIALAHVAATLLVGFGQIAVVVWGIRAMLAANKVRSAGAEEATRLADQRHKEAMAAHVETMAAHAETMAAYKAQAEADKQRHAEAMTALKTLIERTAPRASDG